MKFLTLELLEDVKLLNLENDSQKKSGGKKNERNSIISLQSMSTNGKKKLIPTSKEEAKPGRSKIDENYDVLDYFLSSYSLSNPDSGKHMKPFKMELGNSVTSVLIQIPHSLHCELCQKNTSIINAYFCPLAGTFSSLHTSLNDITGKRVRLSHSLWRKHILLWSSVT